MKDLKYLLGPMRVPFLILGPACVLLGVATAAWRTQAPLNGLYIALAFIGGVAAHISVNAFNEYFDFRSGLDSRTVRTPFSGGSGTLQARPDLANKALATASVAAAIVVGVGLYFVSVWGWQLLPLGIAGVLVIVVYTPWFAHNAFLSLISPGLGFGTLMVLGTDFVLTGTYSWTAAIASFVPFFLVNDLLLLNQFPDVEADRSVDRRNYPILIGRRASSFIYNAFLLLTYVSIGVGVAIGYLPLLGLLGLITLALAVPTMIGAYRYADDLPKLGPYLGFNVLLNILTPVLLAVGLFIA